MRATANGDCSMELLASASGARQILAHFDEINLTENMLGLEPLAIRGADRPLGISARVSIDLLERAAAHLGQPDFGLRHALWLNLRGLDSISLLWDHVGSVGEWYDLASRYVHVENNAVSYERQSEGDEVALLHQIVAIYRPTAVQMTLFLVALTARVFRARFGPRWAPERVEFAFAAPPDLAGLREFFRCRLEFGSARNALVVKRSDLQRPLTPHDPELVAFLKRSLATFAEQRDFGLIDTVERSIAFNLRGKAPSLSDTAALLMLSPRTLQRRLAAHGTSHAKLLEKARRDYVLASRASSARATLAQLAFELGFSEATAASRFVRTKVERKIPA